MMSSNVQSPGQERTNLFLKVHLTEVWTTCRGFTRSVLHDLDPDRIVIFVCHQLVNPTRVFGVQRFNHLKQA
jgi:hypothetical protein